MTSAPLLDLGEGGPDDRRPDRALRRRHRAERARAPRPRGGRRPVPGLEGGPPFRELADGAGVRFGSAVMVRDIRDDPAYAPVLAREFNSVTPFVEMKWGSIHPERDRYEFGMADGLVDFAEAHGMRVRGHALVYGQVVDPPNPRYLSDMTDPDALRTLMREHIRTVASRYTGRVGAWDVVNEPFVPFGDLSRGDGLAQHVFSRVLGPGCVAEALRLARQADPDAQLFLNEFGVLLPGARQDRPGRTAAASRPRRTR